MRVAHIAIEFRFGYQGCNRVNHDHVHRSATDQHLSDFQGLFPGVRLRKKKVVKVHPKFLCIFRVECMLGVDEGGNPTHFLGLRNDVKRETCLARCFGAIDFNDTSAGNPTYAQSGIERDGSGGNNRNPLQGFCLPQFHDRSLTELFFNLRERQFQRFFSVVSRHYSSLFCG